jgi:hypothetical protein
MGEVCGVLEIKAHNPVLETVCRASWPAAMPCHSTAVLLVVLCIVMLIIYTVIFSINKFLHNLYNFICMLYIIFISCCKE